MNFPLLLPTFFLDEHPEPPNPISCAIMGAGDVFDANGEFLYHERQWWGTIGDADLCEPADPRWDHVVPTDLDQDQPRGYIGGTSPR